jgi:nitroreductase/FMN reductase [NAD(P)H]
MTERRLPDLQTALTSRYADAPRPDASIPGSELLHSMLARGSCRAFQDRPVPAGWLDLLSAAALASPTKSDLQQRDIVVLTTRETRRNLADLVPGQAWVASAPVLVVFCGNNHRQRLLHDWHGVAFANDHLDAVINATADAAIALGAFVTAAEALGLGCCPISAVRNEAAAVSDLLALPDHVFPFAGLALGFPAEAPQISPRLPLRVTCHTDTYREEGLREAVQTYDTTRARTQPYATQRLTERFGTDPAYGWSTDKARQYSQPERAGFGAFMRDKGFKLV